jgi:hypothetical protein
VKTAKAALDDLKRNMNKPFGVCLLPVLPPTAEAQAKADSQKESRLSQGHQPTLKLRRIKEKVGCKQGIEISISFTKAKQTADCP